MAAQDSARGEGTEQAGSVNHLLADFHVRYYFSVCTLGLTFDFQEKFITQQLDIASSDPGKCLAWLVSRTT